MSLNRFVRRFLKLGVCVWLQLVAVVAAAAQAGLVRGDPTEKGCTPQYDGFEPHDLAFLTGRAESDTGTSPKSSTP